MTKDLPTKEGLYVCMILAFGELGYTEDKYDYMICRWKDNEWHTTGATGRYWCGMDVLMRQEEPLEEL